MTSPNKISPLATAHSPLFQVALVGAGPGNPGLLTLRAVECLALADVVLYDRLVDVRLLEHARSTAKRVCVDELPGCHPDRWPLIYQAMIGAAHAGMRVVRLKGGDPFIFGRGGEEADALRKAGIAYEVVPGITAALAAGAFAGIPLTHRLHASAVAFVTGHERLDKEDAKIDWSALAHFPGTLVVYMGVARLAGIVAALLENGKPSDTPAVAVSWASTGSQRTVEATLATLSEKVTAAEMKAPALMIIGAVAGLRSELKWFESLPLFGKCVLVTRPRHQASDFVHRLELLGATALVCPGVEVRDPPDWAPVDGAIASLNTFHWLVFTSANGVHSFLRRLRENGRDLRALGSLQLAAIGPATTEALRGYHLEPDLVPAEFRSESLAEDLKTRVAGQRVLLARADRGREVLRDELGKVATVEQVAVYSQVDVQPDGLIVDKMRRGEVDYVTLTSSNIARAVLRDLDGESLERIRSGAMQLVTISPVTSAAVREMNLPVAAEAGEYTTEGVLAALCELAGKMANG